MESISQWTKESFLDAADPRMKDLPLLGSPVTTSIICLVWLWFVLYSGPQYMKSRKPFPLSSTIQIINIIQVLANSFITYEFITAGLLKNYSLTCQPCDTSTSEDAMRIARGCYIYFLLKLFDLADTVIYVLRHKNNQITFLHVYHHVSTLILGWTVATFAPGGHAIFSVMLNAIVHVIMYAYYFLAALGPQYQRFLWWKKYLTRIQMSQFVAQIIHNINALRIGCPYPKFIIYLFLPTIVVIFGLFIDFYVRSYTKRKETKKA